MSKQIIITKVKTGFIIMDRHCNQHGAESLKTVISIIEKAFEEQPEPEHNTQPETVFKPFDKKFNQKDGEN